MTIPPGDFDLEKAISKAVNLTNNLGSVNTDFLYMTLATALLELELELRYDLTPLVSLELAQERLTNMGYLSSNYWQLLCHTQFLPEIRKLLAGHDLTSLASDSLSIAYQQLSSYNQHSGTYFTPQTVGYLIYKMIMDLSINSKWTQASWSVLDPSCGSGSLLRPFTLNPNTNLHGIELIDSLVSSTRARLLMAVDSSRVKIGWGDGLTEKMHDGTIFDSKYQVIVCNPPFGVPISEERQRGFDLKSKKSEVLFVQRCVQLLDPDGFLVLILPNSYASERKSSLRTWLLVEGFSTVVELQLPNTTFAPYTKLVTSLLILQRSQLERPTFNYNVISIGRSNKGLAAGAGQLDEVYSGFQTNLGFRPLPD